MRDIDKRPMVVENFETVVRKGENVKIYIKSSLQEVYHPKVIFFNFEDMNYSYGLNNVILRAEYKNLSIDLKANWGLTNKDYTLFKIYMINYLKINEKEYSVDDLKGKKFVMFVDSDGSLKYSLEKQ